MGPSLFVTLAHTYSQIHTLFFPVYTQGVPLGYLLELFHRGPCFLGRVVLAAGASDRSHCPLNCRGYPRPLAHSQALLPGSGFTSKTQRRRGLKHIFQLTSSPLYMLDGGLTTCLHCTNLPLFSPGTRLCRRIGCFNDLPTGGVTKQGTPSVYRFQRRFSLIQKWSRQ
jgi:hypothetical protein